MGIEKGKHFLSRVVFVDYPIERVMFRCDPKSKGVYRKFYGETEDPQTVPDDNRLFNEALRFGEEITAAEYATGKPKQ